MVRGGPQAFRHPDARGVPQRHSRELGDRRLDQCADSSERASRATSASSCSIDDWQEYRPRRPAAGEPAAGGRISRRGLLPRRRSSSGRRQLMQHGLIRENALTVNGQTIGENCRGAEIEDEDVIRPFDRPLKAAAGFIVLRGNLFDSAIMKTQRDLGRIPQALPVQSATIRKRSKGRSSCSTAPRTITRGSTIRRLGIDARAPSWSCAAPGRSAIPAPPRS